jgi:hypothetical protein
MKSKRRIKKRNIKSKTNIKKSPINSVTYFKQGIGFGFGEPFVRHKNTPLFDDILGTVSNKKHCRSCKCSSY